MFSLWIAVCLSFYDIFIVLNVMVVQFNNKRFDFKNFETI